MARDYYGILGVDRNASDADIKKAFRRKARKYHPDVNDSAEAADKFNELKIAQEVLTDPQKRSIVDAGGDPEAQPNYGGAGGFSGGFGGGGLGDIFEQFFGGAGAGMRGPKPRVRPGNDALVRMKLDLAECYTGVRKEVTVDTAILCDACQGKGSQSGQSPATCPTCQGRGEVVETQRSFLGNVQTVRECSRCGGTGEIIKDPCPKCDGDGRVKKRRPITVDIPAGIDDGMRVRLSGQGEVGPGGGPAGDLYVEVRVTPDSVFVREGDDLHLSVSVPMVDAALGTSIFVKDPVGEEFPLDIAPGTQPDETITVEGRGMPRIRSDRKGNVVVHVSVAVPTKLDSKTEKLLKQVKNHRKDDAVVNDRESGGGFFSRLRSRFAGR
ncbi:molecular chaperone DnaJ [uncultured Corynebacterium sp.]|uniref:molecular chaperone DnaJ n=1 Tax=uncultured Corynebacterium sp. TaxID=159447 RepID=UPI0025FC4BE0|nr:molecular chaperone DnaJ [uncultured Corynebacterium sp.]